MGSSPTGMFREGPDGFCGVVMAASAPENGMSSSGGNSAASLPPAAGTSPASLREDRKRTVEAVTSKEAAAPPSCLVHTRGPPVVLSGVRRPSINTFEPLRRYWLQTSACLPQAEIRNQMVSLTCSPLEAVYWRLLATEKEVTACPEGV